jgi:hypothetical protein
MNDTSMKLGKVANISTRRRDPRVSEDLLWADIWPDKERHWFKQVTIDLR